MQTIKLTSCRTLAAELIARQVDVIVATGGNNPGLVAKSMTSTIPILFTSGVDPVRVGLVTSLSRPEANVTGVSWFGTDMAQKHIELLRELVPSTSLVALLLNRISPEYRILRTSRASGCPGLRADAPTFERKHG